MVIVLEVMLVSNFRVILNIFILILMIVWILL